MEKWYVGRLRRNGCKVSVDVRCSDGASLVGTVMVVSDKDVLITVIDDVVRQWKD